MCLLSRGLGDVYKRQFLTDARTAGMVIAGVDEEAGATPAVPDAVSRQPAVGWPTVALAEVGTAARVAAERLTAARRPTSDARRPTSDFLVSTLRASAVLPAGFVVAVDCSARVEDGDLIASRVALVHARSTVEKPPSRAAARALAAAASGALPDMSAVIPDLTAWFEGVTRTHERSIDARVAREAALRGRPAARALVQPGLFDRRALRAAEDLSENDRTIHAEHRSRIAALERARRLRLSCTPIGVLIVWR